MTIAFKAEGETVFLIGETHSHIGQSLYLREIHGKEEGAPPPVHLTAERRHGKFIRSVIAAREITACHDVSDGGILVAVAEMALAGDIGCGLDIEGGDAGFWFGEDQARYVVTATDPDALEQKLLDAGVPFVILGRTGGKFLTIKGCGEQILLSQLRTLHESWLPHYMGE
jgi:phosphoribosylformylglycinamidine synthase